MQALNIKVERDLESHKFEHRICHSERCHVSYYEKYKLQIVKKNRYTIQNYMIFYSLFYHTTFSFYISSSDKLILELTTNKHFMIELQYLQPHNFLDSSTAIVKLHVRAWLLVSYEKEILGTPNSLLADTLVWCISMQML